MPKNTKQTSEKAASAASKVLRDGRTGKDSKAAAGSALSQTPSKMPTRKVDTLQITEEEKKIKEVNVVLQKECSDSCTLFVCQTIASQCL